MESIDIIPNYLKEAVTDNFRYRKDSCYYFERNLTKGGKTFIYLTRVQSYEKKPHIYKKTGPVDLF